MEPESETEETLYSLAISRESISFGKIPCLDIKFKEGIAKRIGMRMFTEELFKKNKKFGKKCPFFEEQLKYSICVQGNTMKLLSRDMDPYAST